MCIMYVMFCYFCVFVSFFCSLCLPLLLLLYPASFQQEGSSLSAWTSSRFLPVKRGLFSATVLTWEFRLWVYAPVKHLETIFVKAAK